MNDNKLKSVQKNVSAQEIAKFSAMSNDWWNPIGSMKLLHQLNPLRLNYIQGFSTLKDKKILDVGCGAGILAEVLAEELAKVTGIDMSTAVLDIAKKHAKERLLEINYQHIHVEQLAKQQTEKYDLITCMEMLEHVPNPENIIKACATLLKPDGLLLLSTINRNPKAYFLAILGAEYILNLLPKGTHDYQKFIRPSELNLWATSNQLILQDLTGVCYQAWAQKFTTKKNNVSVNYLACYKKEYEYK